MDFYYSKERGGFYISGIHRDIPADVVKITKLEHQTLLIGLSEGKIIDINENGKPFLAYPSVSEEQQQKQKYEQWKAERQAKVDTIVVEIDGMKFDGDEISQERMVRAATLASPDERLNWILADNTVAEVTADQLRRAARTAGEEQVKLWIPQPFIERLEGLWPEG
ncbi:DUF4376 domain-containing protein [Endozoicomonas euniceicola]|uniref:DUF4376 domain-containing protein n=1 Tax=Endozoicomonas euniceicola TaxID=1234143 RepID=A0ABY6GNZ1_9GAMM|nr:DUF4376 domain-containing protein [Endozoicomonas euniceicola]UYM14252.1 DUF4376 domain-containing protein [Endozoicomonas euniceicola]